jgi:hypothetical protein
MRDLTTDQLRKPTPQKPQTMIASFILLALAIALFFFTNRRFLPHARKTGAVTLVNLSGYQWGVEADETGINVESVEVAYRPEFKEFNKNKSGEKKGFAVAEPEGEISISGEVTGSTGLMAATFAAAVTLANDHNLFGLSAGNVYLDEVTETQGREGFRAASFKFSKNKGIAA